jgi:hypothetical protein
MNVKELQAGFEIPSFTRIAYQRALDEFAFLADSSHKDDYAQSRGYPSALLSGYILCGYLSKYFVDFFGPDWLTSGEIELAFVKAVHQRQKITISAQVTDIHKENGGTRVNLDFSIKQADTGESNVIGKASGTIKS